MVEPTQQPRTFAACDRRAFLKTLAAGAAALCARHAFAQSSARRPNILFVYTDDQAPWALHASGYEQAVTPNMDRLVREGAYLPNAFVTTPVCSPARASLLTSRYGTELGILDFIPHPDHKLFTPDLLEIGVDPDLVTFPEVLSAAGYTTGLVGKFHVGDWTKRADKRFHPTHQGYDYFMGLTGGGTSPKDPPLEEDGEVKPFEGLTTDILTDNALDFIREHQDDTFLLSLHYRAPHAPWLPVAEEDWAPFAELDPEIPNPDYPDLNVERVKKMTREYLASVHGVDRNLGRVLALLDELNLSGNTIVIFSSDHGYNMGHNGIWHKGNGKWITNTMPPDTKNVRGEDRPNLYDNSLCVPTMVRWPGVIEPGTVVKETISSLDWYPTLVAMAGAEVPADTLVRGRNFLPLLEGEKVAGWDNDFYAEYSMRCYSKTDMRAWRTPEWKLVRDFLNPERDELYDLKNDPAETTNLIHDERPEVQAIVRELHEKIVAHMKETGDPALVLLKQ